MNHCVHSRCCRWNVQSSNMHIRHFLHKIKSCWLWKHTYHFFLLFQMVLLSSHKVCPHVLHNPGACQTEFGFECEQTFIVTTSTLIHASWRTQDADRLCVWIEIMDPKEVEFDLTALGQNLHAIKLSTSTSRQHGWGQTFFAPDMLSVSARRNLFDLAFS